ncbi:protein of unknown function DUF1611 [Stanieria cyanosphaera PCC 7437]|uniref:DUF1611 domain-containing protein n=1 Tax=Stanieria cyanosphaera (strain ATCC 29371 / PCC 7437) TaxID=111780 RepID=K9XPQ6_STAC7|nr:DUF1611 domain-containing protein [Stanieria cyanosphaera]AFZ34590.1 protein of unknown function DUF1611 [Stanieria cyanosphaera PCC 7437]
MDLTAKRIAILLHEGIKGNHGKTGLAFLRYSQAQIVVVIDAQSAGESLFRLTGIAKEIPIVANVEQALIYTPDVLLIGIAPSGGQLPTSWQEEIQIAIAAGLSLVNGLHTPFALQFPHLQPQQWIWDIRQEPSGLSIGAAKARHLACQRILTVGTDMAVGKMSTSLELQRAAQRQGIKAQFMATGQGGLMIAGQGIPLDAIRVDFAAGAVEQTVIKLGQECDLLMIEGQGSLLHPGSTATLPLLRGSQPTGLILVHRARQTHIRDFPDIPIPSLPEVIQLYESVASAAGTFGTIKVKAIALNTFHLDLKTAQREIQATETITGLPCTDAVRFGADILLNACFSI